jgi:hypothetical protein
LHDPNPGDVLDPAQLGRLPTQLVVQCPVVATPSTGPSRLDRP